MKKKTRIFVDFSEQWIENIDKHLTWKETKKHEINVKEAISTQGVFTTAM